MLGVEAPPMGHADKATLAELPVFSSAAMTMHSIAMSDPGHFDILGRDLSRRRCPICRKRPPHERNTHTMSLPSRTRAAIGVIAFLPTAGAVAQPAYPSKPIRIVIGFAPGGGTDILARALAQQITDTLG